MKLDAKEWDIQVELYVPVCQTLNIKNEIQLSIFIVLYLKAEFTYDARWILELQSNLIYTSAVFLVIEHLKS